MCVQPAETAIKIGAVDIPNALAVDGVGDFEKFGIVIGPDVWVFIEMYASLCQCR